MSTSDFDDAAQQKKKHEKLALLFRSYPTANSSTLSTPTSSRTKHIFYPFIAPRDSKNHYQQHNNFFSTHNKNQHHNNIFGGKHPRP